MGTGARTFLHIVLIQTIQLVPNVQSYKNVDTKVRLETKPLHPLSTVSRVSRSSPAVCKLCRGKPRKCKCYKYIKIGVKSKCAYNERTPCDSTETEKHDAPAFKKNDLSYINKTLEEICGTSPGFNNIHGGRKKQIARQGRIINGSKAKFGVWPWQVSLRQWNRFKGSYLHKCGAALLSTNWAVTAAHCVYRQDFKKILMIMGEHDIYNHREPFAIEGRKIKQIKVHPKFDPLSFENDLALLQFVSPVKYQANILPACLPEDDQDMQGRTGWVTGWGRMKEGGPLASVLQEIEVPMLNNSACEKMYRKAGHPQHIPHIFLCAGYEEGGKDSCDGDSGGPLSVQREDGRFDIAGVVSWGIGCAERNQPGVMTRVTEYKKWIQEIIMDI